MDDESGESMEPMAQLSLTVSSVTRINYQLTKLKMFFQKRPLNVCGSSSSFQKVNNGFLFLRCVIFDITHI